MEISDTHLTHYSIMSYINQGIISLLSNLGVSDGWIVPIKFVVLFFIIAIAALLLYYIAHKTLDIVFARLRRSMPLAFFKYTITNRLPHHLALIIPYYFLRSSMPALLSGFSNLLPLILKILDVSLVFIIIGSIMAVFKSFSDALQEKPTFKDKPMKSYLQVIQIIIFVFGLVAMFSIITGKSATAIFAAMGAASAVTMLVFKDSIMGFVSSIQLTTNNMVKLGDWITIDKYGADGTVDEISLTTVKIVNFDKTITTVPTYALISDSFQNWRGMQESGGRRIKKSLYIKQNTIRFVTDAELAKYREIDYLTEFIANKEKEYKLWNKNVNSTALVGIHRLTNNELFIAYGTQYLRNHPRINKDMTLLLRQMLPTPSGLQVEVYTFTNTVVMEEYEAISTEVLNHLTGVIPFFDLKIFEYDAVEA